MDTPVSAWLEVRGARIPRIGLGTWALTGETCRRAVDAALRMGYRHVDTATIYDNEEDVGRGLAGSGVPREEIFLTTKVWFQDLGYDDVLRSAQRSLKRLATTWVDLLLVHWPNEKVRLKDTLDAFLALRDRGLVRHVGVSNFPPSLVRKAVAIAPVLCNQVEYHPFLAQPEQLALAKKHDFAVVAYSPLARGRVRREAALSEIGRRHGRSAAQVALRWLMQQERVAAIPKASTPKHLEENLRVFDFVLSPDEMDEVSSCAREERLIDPDFAPSWRS
jgi:diketogulonate reductase-like aldo/keto reductase